MNAVHHEFNRAGENLLEGLRTHHNKLTTNKDEKHPSVDASKPTTPAKCSNTSFSSLVRTD
jgi:hypothetical protein